MGATAAAYPATAAAGRAVAPLGAAPARADVSVLVPAKDEAENLPLFMEQAAAAFAADPGVRYEVVVVDDGSEDDSCAVLRALEERYPFLQSVRDAAAHAVPHTAQERVALLEPAQHRAGVVFRAVVDDHYLITHAGVGGERGGRLLHEQRQVLRLVLGWDKD